MKKLLSLIVLSLVMMTSLAWAQTYLINEGFESTTFPPDGWTASTSGVARSTSTHNNGSACAVFKATGGFIYTPQLSNPDQLSFWCKRSGNTTAWTLKVQVSTDKTNWTDIGTITITSVTNTYQEFSYDLSSYSNIYIRLFDQRASGAHERYIDDFTVTARSDGGDPPPAPTLAVSPTSLTGFSYEVGDTSSESQSFTVYRANFEEKIVVSAPTNYQLSTNRLFNNSQNQITINKTVPSQELYVRLAPGLPIGNYNDSISIEPENPVAGISTATVSLSGAVTAVVPKVTISKSSLSGFSYMQNNGPSDEQSFSVKGKQITDHIAVFLSEATNSPFEFRIEDDHNYITSTNLEDTETYTIDTTIYVRLKEGLAMGSYSDTIEFTCINVSGNIPSITLSGVVNRYVAPNDYYVDFEDATKGGYASGNVTLSGKIWNMTEALIGGSDVGDFKIDSKSARIRGYGTSAMTMLEDKSNGLGTLSFYYRRYGGDTQVDWKVEYSRDGGVSWIQLGNNFKAPSAAESDDIQQFLVNNINIPGNIRIRIIRADYSQNSENTNRRLNIDDIFLVGYTGDAPQYEIVPNVAVTIGKNSSATITGISFQGANTIVVDPEDFTPFPNADFVPEVRGKWQLFGSGNAVVTVSTPNDWFAWNVGGDWNTIQGPVTSEDIVIDLDAKNADFEFMTGSGTSPTLPVELSSFTVTQNSSGKPVITWQTQTETGVNGFYIYRGINKNITDAALISSLVPATNSSLAHSYSFIDTDLSEDGTYYYWLNVSDLNGHESYYGPAELNFVLTDEDTVPEVTYNTALRSIYPNPFNPSANIGFELAEASEVKISVYNTRGQLVRSFAPFTHDAGQGSIAWDGKDEGGNSVSSGIYLFRMTVGAKSYSAKALMMK